MLDSPCMRLVILCVATLSLHAQKTSTSDPLSGTWTGEWGTTPTHRHRVVVELRWDGKSVQGTVNPGPTSVKLKKTSFDPATGSVHFEADAGPEMGKPSSHYIIDGKVEDDTLTGNWNHPKRKGDFKLVKKLRR
jgi:hypothetical protein